MGWRHWESKAQRCFLRGCALGDGGGLAGMALCLDRWLTGNGLSDSLRWCVNRGESVVLRKSGGFGAFSGSKVGVKRLYKRGWETGMIWVAGAAEGAARGVHRAPKVVRLRKGISHGRRRSGSKWSGAVD